MAQALEAFAVKQVMSRLNLPPDAIWPKKNKRRRLFDIIMQEESDESLGGWKVNLEEGCTMWEEFKKWVPRLPDAMCVIPSKCHAVFVEIEDSNPVPEEKLDLYYLGSSWLDAIEWSMSLVVADRYGQSIRFVPLAAWGSHSTMWKLERPNYLH